MSSCAIPVKQEEIKKEGPVKKLVRRVKEACKPTYAWVRYDTSKQEWAVLDQKTLQPTRHFSYGVMTDVEFGSERKIEGGGCGGTREVFMGIAKGNLRSDTYGKDASGFHNLNFADGHFRGEEGSVIKSASVLRLLEGRRSLYK